MTKLVEQLRDWAIENGAPIWTEAADEIERLTDCYEGEIQNRLLIASSHDKQTIEIEKMSAVVEVARKVVHEDDSYYNVNHALEDALAALDDKT
jgi:hypothetical protein